MPDWWLDELAHAGAEHLDASYVAGYERKAGFDPSVDVEALRELGLGPASRVIDLGAGTGRFALAVAPFCAEVVAVDVSPAMVSVMEQAVRSAAVSNVRVVRAGMLSYAHAGPPVDFAYSRNALHQVPDFWKGMALRRIRSVLRPGGVLLLRDLIYDFGPEEAEERMAGWMAGAVGDASVGYTAGELAAHVRGEFSTFRWVLEGLLSRAGFGVEEVGYERGVYGRYVCR